MKHAIAALLLLCASGADAVDWEASAEVAAVFRSAGVDGTFVLYDVDAQRLIGYDRVRAGTRFVPASTFKIPHTLIGLSVRAVRSVDEVLPYGGLPQPFQVWEKDMGLRDAIALSSIPIYQELARRIHFLSAGRAWRRPCRGWNTAIAGQAARSIPSGWTVRSGSAPSSRARLAKGQLPFPVSVQEDTLQTILVERREGRDLYAKTGWENAPQQGVGWWVGWVRQEDRVYAFALNIDIRQPGDADRRIELGRASLEALGTL